MKKEFVTYDQGITLKRLGFDERCLTGFSYEDDKLLTEAPLKQQVLRWFREKHNLVSWVYIGNVDRYFYTIIEGGRFVVDHKVYQTYEEAEDACINKLIEIIKEK
jgi:hypothetical protein